MTMNTPDIEVKLEKCLCNYQGARTNKGHGQFAVVCTNCYCDAKTPFLQLQSIADAAWNRMMDTAHRGARMQTVALDDARTLLSVLADHLEQCDYNVHPTMIGKGIANTIRDVLAKKP
jgi:hypothetical protein